MALRLKRSTLIRYLPYLVLRAIKNIPTWQWVINFEIKLNAHLFCTKDYNGLKNIEFNIIYIPRMLKIYSNAGNLKEIIS